jgi:hypothetical protein
MGREARRNGSAAKSAEKGHKKPVKREVKIWTLDELRAKVLAKD